MNIRIAKDTEAQEIYSLLYETALWIKPKCENQWPISWLEEKKQDIFNSVTKGNFYVFYIYDELTAVVEVKSEPESIWGYDEESAYYVHKLAVRRKSKGNALGVGMLNYVMELANLHNVSTVRLDCVTENKKLHEYYLTFGFTYIGSSFDEGTEVSLFEIKID